jgi:hypothetical protein
MNRNKNRVNDKKNYKGKKYAKNGKYRKEESKEYTPEDAKLNASGRDNDPNWYFLDKEMADQVSQFAFQELAGTNLQYGQNGTNFVEMRIPSIMNVFLNPSPGVQNSLGGVVPQRSGINLAGFRLYSKLAAYTGRQAVYGPQDISTMILKMGEVISEVEFVRRAFGVAFTYNMRNRAYPRAIIKAMGIDADDLFEHYSDYRTRFNGEITKLNQIPIPKNVAYFDKCAALYEKIYLDADSPMAQTIILQPCTTWELDESSYSGGTILKTSEWRAKPDGTGFNDTHTMGYYLAMLFYRVEELLTSSTLQVVYTDLLNLATKMKVDFWKFDYLVEGYTVWPEYNRNFLLQFHNMVATGFPRLAYNAADLAVGYTPNNDVYPDANNNILLYNPGFAVINAEGRKYTCAPASLLIDTDNPSVTVEDRIEMTRFGATCAMNSVITQGTTEFAVGCCLPDHYVVKFQIVDGRGNLDQFDNILGFGPTDFTTTYRRVAELSAFDWAPRVCLLANEGMMPVFNGDLNYYTELPHEWFRKVNDFIGLALYDLR